MEHSNKYFEAANAEWSGFDFGDKRLNSRAARIGASFLANPFATPPKMLKFDKDIKAFYRFMDSDKVSHGALVLPHTLKSKERLSEEKVVLSIQDSTTLVFDRELDVEGAYDVGSIQGVLVHNTISVIPHKNYGLVDGLLHQIVHKRKPKATRTERDNEIRLWTDSIKAVGTPPAGTIIVDVMDRGSDSLFVMHCSKENGHEFIIRAHYNRLLKEGEHKYLFDFARSLPRSGEYALSIQGGHGKKGRIAKLGIAYSKITIPSPKNHRHQTPVECNIVHVQEAPSPKVKEPLEWLLFTSLPVNSFNDALTVSKYYSYRWIIEEYHKCLKTGFRIEQTQLQTLDRIESLLGFIAVASIKLLQLRDIVRRDPQTDAKEYVEEEDIQIARAYYKVQQPTMTIDRFLRYIAQMGGFLNRKGDGNPGWQSLWDGWKFFLGLKEGVRLQKEIQLMGKG